MQQATLIKPDGQEEKIEPQNKTTFTDEELRTVLHAHVLLRTDLMNGAYMVRDNGAYIMGKDKNLPATRLLHSIMPALNYIAMYGDVVHVHDCAHTANKELHGGVIPPGQVVIA